MTNPYPKLTSREADNTINSIYRHIEEEEGRINTEMTRFLIQLAERAYEIKGEKNPHVNAASFVITTITAIRSQKAVKKI